MLSRTKRALVGAMLLVVMSELLPVTVATVLKLVPSRLNLDVEVARVVARELAACTSVLDD